MSSSILSSMAVMLKQERVVLTPNNTSYTPGPSLAARRACTVKSTPSIRFQNVVNIKFIK